MSLKIEAVTPEFSATEGPFWDIESQCLYFVDVIGKAICKYNPSANTCSRGVMPDSEINSSSVSFVIPMKNEADKFLVGYGSNIVTVRWDGVSDKLEKVEIIVDLESIEEGARWNDAKIDSNGQLWVGYLIRGTESLFKPKAGGLYTINLSDRTLKKQLSEISLANGMEWSESNKKYYFADSVENALMEFDCNLDAGEITNKQTIFKCPDGFPDGLTVDADNNLWIATFAWKVVKVNPSNPNVIAQTIEFPVEQITSCAFGGTNLDELYVTSASFESNGKKPKGGSVYRVTGLNVRGVACHKALLN